MCFIQYYDYVRTVNLYPPGQQKKSRDNIYQTASECDVNRTAIAPAIQ